jgi:hypothetical protein
LSYQSRRLNIRYKDKNNKKIFPHTISATAVTDRVLLAIMENNQTRNSTILVPNKLISYMGGIKEITNAMSQKLVVSETQELYSRDNRLNGKAFIDEEEVSEFFKKTIN